MSKSYKRKKLLLSRYQLLATIMFLLAAGLLLLPKYEKNEGINPDLFVKNLMSSERYISTDLLADRLVNQDPVVLLVDVRSEEEFKDFALPNAINIPLENLLDENFEGFINQDIYDVILYSNDNFYADQAWIICNRLGYANLYVLKGGLNEWFNTIIRPEIPDETMPREAFDLYSFRKAAGMYFGVGLIESDTVSSLPVKKVIPVKRKKKRVPEGGC